MSQRDPVGFWLGRLGKNSVANYRSVFSRFLAWSRLGADELLEKQRVATARGSFEVLDLVQSYVSGLDLTRGTKLASYNVIRSFFKHNRVPLPDDGSFIVRSEKAGSTPKLTLDHVKLLALNANLRDRSLILVKWQSMVDSERLANLGRNCAEQIAEQIKKGVHPVRIDIPDRKQNRKGYYTFIGKDAIDALREYFDKERGWPRGKEPIWVGHGKALSTRGIKAVWLRLTKRGGLIPKRGGKRGTRYGYGNHEMRDLVKSLLHTHAKSEGFDMDCSEFWLGHTVDPLGYDKFMLDQEYVRKQYLIAEPYLNILSGQVEATQKQQAQEERISYLEWKLGLMFDVIDTGNREGLESIRLARARHQSIR
jgi:integrase